MRRPRITAKVVRGLREVRSLASVQLEAGVLESFDTPQSEIDDAERAVEYIDELVEWFERRGVEET